MSAMTTSPACASPGGSTSGSFGAASVTVIDASMQSPIRCGVSADSPLGRSIDDDRDRRRVDVGDDRFHHPAKRRLQPGAEDRVDDQRALRDLGEVQLPALLVVDLDDGDAEPAEDLEIHASRRRGRRRSVPIDEHRRVDAALQQRPRDDEAVAAVVAAPAQDRHAAVEPRLRRPPPSPPPPGGRRSPSAPATGCRCLRS